MNVITEYYDEAQEREDAAGRKADRMEAFRDQYIRDCQRGTSRAWADMDDLDASDLEDVAAALWRMNKHCRAGSVELVRAEIDRLIARRCEDEVAYRNRKGEFDD